MEDLDSGTGQARKRRSIQADSDDDHGMHKAMHGRIDTTSNLSDLSLQTVSPLLHILLIGLVRHGVDLRRHARSVIE